MSALDEILKARGMGVPPSVIKEPVSAPRSKGAPIVYDCIQGSEEWALLRCGVPTASQFHRVLTRGGKKGPQPSSQQWDYLMQLVAERWMGEPLDPPKTSWMNRGHELEPEAVAYYHLMTGTTSRAVGFITNNTGTMGASSDRLVNGVKRGLEIKCPSPNVHMNYLLMEGELAADHFIQCQGQMLVGELEDVDLVSYFPGLPTAIHRTVRDGAYIKALDEELQAFCGRLAELQAKLTAMIGDPEPKSPPLSQASVIEAMKDAMIETQK